MVQTVQTFFALLASVAVAGSVIVAAAHAGSRAGFDSCRKIRDTIAPAGLWIAFIVAAVATAGSLYFSERAGFVPCKLCWYQRIAMYPLTVIFGIAALRDDRKVTRYTTPLAVIGAVVAGWHSLIEWRPALEVGSCSVSGPSCTAIWFREFGVFTLATMAFVAFVTVIAFSHTKPDITDNE